MTTLEARVEGVFVGDKADTLETTPRNTINILEDGVEGDKHRGFMREADSRTPHITRGTPIPNTRMWSGVEVGELQQIADKFQIPQVEASWLGANFVVGGIARFRFTQLPPGTVFQFSQGTELLVDAENTPCLGPGEVIASKFPDGKIKPNLFQKNAIHRRGLVGVVKTPGPVSKNETVKIFVYDPTYYSIPPASEGNK